MRTICSKDGDGDADDCGAGAGGGRGGGDVVDVVDVGRAGMPGGKTG
jgi:hypothetical protein